MKYHSKHTFMFPFQWDYITKNKRSLYNERTKLEDFQRLFDADNNGFKLKKFKIDNDADKYNEFSYFHPFARKALYYTDNNNLLRYYELDQAEGVYNIEYLQYNKEIEDFDKNVLKLSLDSICLHVYDTGVGVLSFNLTNFHYSLKEDILKINEFGRRMYPQFMTQENNLAAKMAFLPNRIWGEIGNLQFDEDFSAYQSNVQTDSVFLPPDHIKKVFGYVGEEQIGDIDKNFVFRKQDEQTGTIRISPITDDRMFFLCWYGNNDLANSFYNLLTDKNEENENKKSYLKNANHINSYELDDYWYAFMFGDKDSASVENIEMQRMQTKQSTYSRWLNYGTLFGVTRDSFVSISSDIKTLTQNYSPPINIHTQTMYYQMAVLCLVQRASILRFSKEIAQITDNVFRYKRKPEKAIRELYENYMIFINQIYFREVTSQIQGIELYAMFQQEMNLEKEAKDLDTEMQELFNYLSVTEQTKLAKVANLFLPISLFVGILGVNTFNFQNLPSSVLYLFNLVGGIWFFYVILQQFFNKK